MNSRDFSRLMWSEALSMLEQADRLHRQFFQPAATQAPAWEPPVDVIESAEAVWVQVALPGADPVGEAGPHRTAHLPEGTARRGAPSR